MRKIENLKKPFGIIPEIPYMYKGKVLSKEAKYFVQDFYQFDEISRICSEEKKTISVQNPSTGKIRTCPVKAFSHELKKLFLFLKK